MLHPGMCKREEGRGWVAKSPISYWKAPLSLERALGSNKKASLSSERAGFHKKARLSTRARGIPNLSRPVVGRVVPPPRPVSPATATGGVS